MGNRVNELPEWLIGDSHDRTFIVHLHYPRFLAEVSEPYGEDINVVDWYDDPPVTETPSEDAAYLARLMREAGDFWLAESERE